MNKSDRDFKKAFHFEITLIVLFIATSGSYVLGIIPSSLEGEILGIVGFVGIVPVARSAFESLKNRKINVDLLATIALFFSFISAEWGSMLFINIMLAGARLLDVYTKRRVRVSLESLAKLKPLNARVLRGEEATEVPLSAVQTGDLVMVNLGEEIPVDGIVASGSATVNQASLTGESIPVLCGVGSSVLSATTVVSGNIIVRVERVGKETTFERMIDLVEGSSNAKTRMKTLAEQFASWYIGLMLVVAIILYLITNDSRLVLAVVLVVCADDIAIAVPLAYIIAIGTAARRGVIIKSADFLEQAGKITTLIVDKTGTLTLGKLSVVKVETINKAPERPVLDLAGTITARSNHPVAKAIIEYAKRHGCLCETPEHFKEIEGRGIISKTDDQREVILGRPEFLNERGVPFDTETARSIAKGVSSGDNMTILAVDKKVVGIFTLADEMRAGVKQAITSIKQNGVTEIIMLTGDNEGVAKTIAEQLGVDKYYSKLLPEHKVFVLKDYLGKKDRVVAMVGDGVNDSAVLARADIGIAMGGIGSDAAIESADIVLMQDDFRKINEVRTLSKKVRSIVQGNFAIWGIVNAIGLYLVFIHVLNPAGAAAYNFLTDFIPIANSLRLFRYRQKAV